MNWLNKLERKFGNLYIRNLMLIIVLGNAVIYFITMINGNNELISNIVLDSSKVLNGEVWRLITFIFVPESTSAFWVIFTLYFYYLAGAGLEEEWGGFKFNAYYLIGMLASIIIAFLTGKTVTGSYVNLSLFLAFAKIYPNFQLLLFFIIPIKVKYIAIFNWIMIGISVLSAIFSKSLNGVIIALIPVVNYLIFFGKSIFTGTKSSAMNYHRKQKFKSKIREAEFIHKCVVCGITEKDNTNMEFRYCSKCSGKKCYCINHIKNHEHK